MSDDVLASHASPTLPAARVWETEVAKSRTLPVKVLIHRTVGLPAAIMIMAVIADIVPAQAESDMDIKFGMDVQLGRVFPPQTVVRLTCAKRVGEIQPELIASNR